MTEICEKCHHEWCPLSCICICKPEKGEEKCVKCGFPELVHPYHERGTEGCEVFEGGGE